MSGEWFGEIPEHWESEKIGALFAERRMKVSDKDYAPLSVAKIGVVPQLETAVKTDAGDNRKLVCKGDFVINSRSDRKGSCGVSKLDGSVSLINIVLTPRGQLSGGYTHYLLRSQPFAEEYYRNGRGIVSDLWTTRYSEMKSIILPVPPRDEQEQIVCFLDWKVSAINRLIGNYRHRITTLEMMLQRVINDYLIYGCKKNQPLQNITDVATSKWMPQIPSHWELSQIGKHFIIKKRIAGREGFPVLSITQQGLKEKDIASNEGQMANDYSGYQFVYPGDFAMNHMDLLTGYIGISSQLGVTSPDYRVFTLEDTARCYADYYLLLFQLCYKRRIFYAHGRGAAAKGRWRLPAENFKHFIIPLPPIEEQKEIVNSIKPMQHIIKNLIQNIEQKITALHELRARLISDVVTGKIDVRGVEVPEYAPVEEEAGTDIVEEEVSE